MRKLKFEDNLLGLKKFNTLLITALLMSIVLVSLVGVYAKARHLQAYAAGVESAQMNFLYKEPPLAPQNEKEANIALIRKVWGKDAKIGLELARCESGYRTRATNINKNGSKDEGVFQINSIHKMPDMLNATANILYAYTKFLQQGVQPWYSSNSCHQLIK